MPSLALIPAGGRYSTDAGAYFVGVDEQHDAIGEDGRQLREARVALGGGHVRPGRVPPAKVSRRSSSHIGSLATSSTKDPSGASVRVTRVRSDS